MASPPWTRIDTVLLDMDGTLLDLRFDNHFWLEHLPARWAALHGREPAVGYGTLASEFEREPGISGEPRRCRESGEKPLARAAKERFGVFLVARDSAAGEGKLWLPARG